MRKVDHSQLKFGQVDISKIEFNLRCRDEIPKLLMGLQYIYCTPLLRDQVFTILEQMIPKNVDRKKGRPGLELWKIFVMATIRLNCNWDYDKLQDIVNNHKTIRQMLGHGTIDEDYTYHLQTLKDNVSLLTEEVLHEVNEVVVKAGHNLVMGKKNKQELRGRCDSFVVETDVHFPTDINLLWDAIRKVIILIAYLCSSVGFPSWRQYKHNLKTIKKVLRHAQRLKHSTSKNEQKRAERSATIAAAYRDYLTTVTTFLEKAIETRARLQKSGISPLSFLMIEKYIRDVRRQIDQIQRRVIDDEQIPHAEKVFSIFEEHTEWICKGKAGIPQELGKRVCIVEDQYGFLLHAKIMEKETDDKIAEAIVRETKEKFDNFSVCSFDKGFWSPENKVRLDQILDVLILPKKGRRSAADNERENSPEFIEGRKKHAAVESAINALENHGLDRCSDRGMRGFRKYVALAVAARNIQKIGHVLQEKKLKRELRKEKYRNTMTRNKLAS